MGRKDITVVILNWNGAQMLRRFLPSVIRYSPEAYVMVADNGSTDESLQMLGKDFPEVEVVAFDSNYGFAEGYNKAIRQVKTPYAVLLNDDVEVTSDWLVALYAFMENHKEVAACQPKILSEMRRSNFEYAGAAGGFIDCWGYPYCRGRMLDAVEEDKGQYNTPCPVFWATGAALFIRRDVYLKEGGLDSRFFAHMEEIDLCWRLRSRGYGIWCIPQSCVYHVGGGTLNKTNPHKTYLNFRNNLLLLYKNMSERSFRHVYRIRVLLDMLAALKMLLCVQTSDAAAIVKAHRDFKKMRPDFTAAQKENQEKCVVHAIPERQNRSLLVAFYLRRIRKFSEWLN